MTGARTLTMFRRHDESEERVRGARTGGVTLLAGVLIALGAHVPAHAADELLRFTDPGITESSGLAWDPDQQLFWTTNDSGDTGRVFAVGRDGNTVGTLEFNAPVVDVEALARTAEGRLYVGDIGDNDAVRDHVTVYWFDRASPDDSRGGSYRAWDFTYPDGPHDAETLMVNDQGRLFIVTKGAEGGIYAAPEEPTAQGQNQLELIGEAPAFVTDGVFLEDGSMALRTYTSIEVIEPELLSTTARAALPFQPQGETIARHPDDAAQVVIGSEGVNQPLLAVPVPQDVQIDAPADPAPPPEPAPEQQPPGDDPAHGPADPAMEDPGTNRSGTIIVLTLALLVSLAAGVYVWFRDRAESADAAPEPDTPEDTAVLGRRDPNRGYPLEGATDPGDSLMPRPPTRSHGPAASADEADLQRPRRAIVDDVYDQEADQEAHREADQEADAEPTLARPEDWWRGSSS